MNFIENKDKKCPGARRTFSLLFCQTSSLNFRLFCDNPCYSNINPGAFQNLSALSEQNLSLIANKSLWYWFLKSSVFFACPWALCFCDFGLIGEAWPLDFHAPIEVKHCFFKNRLFELWERVFVIFYHVWSLIWGQSSIKHWFWKGMKKQLERRYLRFDPWKIEKGSERVKTFELD